MGPPATSAEVTQLLRAASGGSDSAASRLMPLVYDELRRLAQHYLTQERANHTLSATALVHEAYLKLVDQRQARWSDQSHFFAVAAQAIRRILIDHARGRNRAKRDGGAQPGTLPADAVPTFDRQVDLSALDEALVQLTALNARQAQIVEMRFFGGLSIDEIAKFLDVSPRTVDGEWAMARAWLRRALRDEESG